ncbi:MAG: homocysteine S-methyltransferase family protein, partial [Desulfovibrio sp.]|nr:homocysteine S-methyltransferase family protein [Desulfovibrio sp.]
MKDNADSFSLALRAGRTLFLDGAMGTMLQAGGMPPGVSPDLFCLENPEILMDIHLAYIEAGSDIITSCTFGANSYKLPPGANVFEINRKLVQIAAEAAARGAAKTGRRIYVAGDVGPTGHFLKPLGQVEPAEMTEAFREQIAGLAAGGADLVFMETQFDLAEIRSAVVAARETCDLPVMVSMTFEDGATLTGSTPEIYARTLQNMDVDVIGANCSQGPDEMRPIIRELTKVCSVPVMAEPNAGLPVLRDGKTVFPQSPEQFAEKTAEFVSLGARILGGCCGTTPAHIKKLRQYAENIPPVSREIADNGVFLSSRSSLVRVAPDASLKIIGERVNPTGKPILAKQLREGEFQEAARLADEQIAAGADVLDINVGAPLVDEARVLPRLAALFSGRFQTPLSLDSSNAAAIAAALPYCPGSALVNSISGEAGRMENLAPLCKKYGAPFVLLPLSGATLPEKLSARLAIIEDLISRAEKLGIKKRLILVDALALAVSSSSDAGKVCLDTLEWCRDAGLATTLGLSNISFGLPARALLNSVYLGMAFAAGLRSCIANPSAPR